MLLALLAPPSEAHAQGSQVTAFDLIIAMNTLRASYGLHLLAEDPVFNAVAQSTTEIMAANNMSWHIGDVRGWLQATRRRILAWQPDCHRFDHTVRDSSGGGSAAGRIFKVAQIAGQP